MAFGNIPPTMCSCNVYVMYDTHTSSYSIIYGQGFTWLQVVYKQNKEWGNVTVCVVYEGSMVDVAQFCFGFS